MTVAYQPPSHLISSGVFQLITLRAKLSGAVYCYRSCLFATGGRTDGVYGGRASDLEIACIDLHQTGSVGAGSDHLQLVKFWRSCVPGNGICGGAKIVGSTYYSQRAVFASL